MESVTTQDCFGVNAKCIRLQKLAHEIKKTRNKYDWSPHIGAKKDPRHTTVIENY